MTTRPTERPQQSQLTRRRCWKFSHNDYGWILLGFRVMLAIGVIQMMPDQELFALMHNRPPKHNFDRKQKWWPQIKSESWPFLKGHICLHLNKSSPVFAILAAIAPGLPG
ncbi:MAG: hypothetical protein ACKVHE_18815 [Planctomycetales bacterium]